MTQYTHMVEVEVSEDGTQTVTPSVLFGLISHLNRVGSLSKDRVVSYTEVTTGSYSSESFIILRCSGGSIIRYVKDHLDGEDYFDNFSGYNTVKIQKTSLFGRYKKAVDVAQTERMIYQNEIYESRKLSKSATKSITKAVKKDLGKALKIKPKSRSKSKSKPKRKRR